MVAILARLSQWWADRHAANADIDDCQPMLPWGLCAVATVIIPVLLAGAVYFARLSHDANPPSRPTLEDHRP